MATYPKSWKIFNRYQADLRFWIWNFGIWDFAFCFFLDLGMIWIFLFFFDLVFLVTVVTVVRAAAVPKGGVCLPKGERVA